MVKKLGNNSFVSFIALSVVFLGILVILGWILDIPLLKSIVSGTITIKFFTALTFVLCGISLYCMSSRLKGWREIVFVVSSMFILLLTLIFSSSSASGVLIFETLFIQDIAGSGTLVPGQPALVTMLNFLLFSFFCLLHYFNAVSSKPFKWIGIVLMIDGAAAVIGYALNVPLLYYSFGAFINPISINTALLFILLGYGVFSYSKI